MNSMRKIILVVFTMAITAFALPAIAASKQAAFNVFQYDATHIGVEFTNLTPDGNSTINSIIVTVPANIGIPPTAPRSRSNSPCEPE